MLYILDMLYIPCDLYILYILLHTVHNAHTVRSVDNAHTVHTVHTVQYILYTLYGTYCASHTIRSVHTVHTVPYHIEYISNMWFHILNNSYYMSSNNAMWYLVNVCTSIAKACVFVKSAFELWAAVSERICFCWALRLALLLKNPYKQNVRIDPGTILAFW